jgi:hypothetical protein
LAVINQNDNIFRFDHGTRNFVLEGKPSRAYPWILIDELEKKKEKNEHNKNTYKNKIILDGEKNVFLVPVIFYFRAKIL